MNATLGRYRIWFASHPRRLSLTIAWLSALIWIPASIGFVAGVWFGLAALLLGCAVSTIAIGRTGIPLWMYALTPQGSLEVYNPPPPPDSAADSGC